MAARDLCAPDRACNLGRGGCVVVTRLFQGCNALVEGVGRTRASGERDGLLRLPVVTDPNPAPSTALPYPTASWGHRVLALFVDWIASWLVVALIFGWDDVVRTGSQASTWTLLVYVVESVVLTTLAGGSFG